MASNQHGKTRVSVVRAQTMAARALELRLDGWGYVNIGAELGITSSVAYRYVADALEEVRFEKAELALELRDLILMRNDMLIETLLPKAVSGDLFSMDRLIRVHEQSANLAGAFARAEKDHEEDSMSKPMIVLPSILNEEPVPVLPSSGMVVQGQLTPGDAAPITEADEFASVELEQVDATES